MSSGVCPVLFLHTRVKERTAKLEHRLACASPRLIPVPITKTASPCPSGSRAVCQQTLVRERRSPSHTTQLESIDSLRGKTHCPREQQNELAWKPRCFLRSSREASSHLSGHQHQPLRVSALYGSEENSKDSQRAVKSHCEQAEKSGEVGA